MVSVGRETEFKGEYVFPWPPVRQDGGGTWGATNYW